MTSNFKFEFSSSLRLRITPTGSRTGANKQILVIILRNYEAELFLVIEQPHYAVRSTLQLHRISLSDRLTKLL